jgi:hypothetical protein
VEVDTEAVSNVANSVLDSLRTADGTLALPSNVSEITSLVDKIVGETQIDIHRVDSVLEQFGVSIVDDEDGSLSLDDIIDLFAN